MINRLFFREASIAPLVAFRIIFGALLLFSTLRFVAYGWVDQIYIQPIYHFTYYGFDWVHVLPGQWMYLPFILMAMAALGIIFGAWYRFSTTLYFVCFTYIELIDKSTYLNHYYFVSLVTFLLIFLPANADFSWDARRKDSIRRSQVPSWTIFILQFQLAVVYFFAGAAKVNSDWLIEAQPLHLWLQSYRDLPVVGNWFAAYPVALLFSWFGCLYDLTIPFFLWSNRFRNLAYFFVVAFHILTWYLFPIGVFPWVMICSTLIFFPEHIHQRILAPLKRLFHWKNTIRLNSFRVKSGVRAVLLVYIVAQLLLPFRYLLYPSGLFWHEEGFRFSWRVMLIEKKGYATFYVEDSKTGGSIEIDNYRFLTPQQIDQMSRQPDMILQYAHYLGKRYSDTTLTFSGQTIRLQNPRVTAEVYVTLNGRPNQLFVSRKWNLLEQTYNLKHRLWVEPFNE